MVETASASVVTFAREYVRRVEKKKGETLATRTDTTYSMKSRYDRFQRSLAI